MFKKKLHLIKNPKQLAKESKNFLLSNEGTLKKKVIRGGFWVFALRIFRRGFEFIRTIVLARLLAPEDFGLMGIALLAMSALESFSQTGVQQALIQKKGDIKDYLDTAWTIQVIRGGVIAVILFFGASLVGRFFGEPNAVPLTRALALSEIFKALTHIGVVYFQKELEFHKQFIYQISGTFADLLISIPAAIILRNPWALVYGLLIGNFIRMILSHRLLQEDLKLKLYKKQLNFFKSYGFWLFFATIFNFIAVQGDDVYVGKAIGAVILGIYQMSYKITNTFAKEIISIFSSVMFPSLSKVKNNMTRLRKHFFKYLKIIAISNFIIGILVFIFLPLITKILFTEEWVEIIPIGRILIIAGFIRACSSIYGPLYLALGKTKTKFLKQGLRMLFTFLPLVFVKNPGIYVVSWFVVLGISVALMIDLIQTVIIFKNKNEKTS